MTIFSFQNLGHAFASVLHDVHVGLTWAGQELSKIQAAGPGVAAITPAIAALLPSLAPAATEIERAAFSLLGTAAAAVVAAAAPVDPASVGEQLVAVHLDAATVTAIKDLIAKYKPQLAAAGIAV